MIGNNQVDAVFLNSGERYDLQLVKTTHRNVDGFRIRIDTSAKYDDEGNEAAVQYYYGEAILNCGHEGHSTLHPSPILEVDTTHCTGAKKCKVLNCPFRQFPPSDVFHCVNIRDYKSARRLENRLSNKHPDDEIFLNIGGIESESFFKINNIKMTQATFPPYEAIRQGGKLGDVAELCDTDCGQQKRCECFEPVTLEKDRLVQFVIYNKINKTDAKVSMGHPFHFHGYHFYVVKVGYPSYDSSGFVHEAETDITCTTTNCTLEKWAEKPNFRETDFNYIDPPYKDTIFVPYGGYVVIRFISHNIGWFVIHCHMVIHEGNGLMRPLKVGTDEEIENLVQHKRPHEYQSCPTCK